jgi:dihydrofolate reductase
MKRIIVAVSPEGAIGVDNRIPWHYASDLRRFKRLTMGSTVIMGRLTFESMNRRPLPGRRNIVITRSPIEGVETHPDLDSALRETAGDVWFIGGRQIYEEAMRYADEIDMTYVPDAVEDPRAVLFPSIDTEIFFAEERIPDAEEPGLVRQVFKRRP